MLILDDISVRMAGRLLIDHASLNLPSGTKAGLVGRNGAGKSTLFKVITGELHAETGDFFLPKNIRIGQVAQEAPGTEDSLIEIVLAADQERTALLAESETATDPHRIAEIHIRLADIDAHSAEARAGSILSGLGFDAEAQKRPASSFSGGWRMRVALAAVLFAEPDLLLLDEPTNYLDLEGTLWLEDYVRRYPHTVILISHDRDLLNSAVNSIIHLDQTKLTLLAGQLRPVRAAAFRSAGTAAEAACQAGSASQPYGGFRRTLPGQGLQGQAGAIAPESPAETEAHFSAYRRSCDAVSFSGTGKSRGLADHRH